MDLRVFAATAPTDMRKSFAGLVGLVERELGQHVEAGGLFLFFSRRRNAIKVLFFTGDGLAIFYRRLERGTFELPRAVDQQADAKGIELKRSELTLILEGIELASVKRRRRWSLPQSAGDISHKKSVLPGNDSGGSYV